jgi:hypothetical protein
MQQAAKSGLMASVTWHCWQFLSFRGDWRRMPDSMGFVWVAMSGTLFGGLAEQLARGRPWVLAMVTTLVWLGLILAVSRKDGQINRRLAAALGILSMGIQALLVLSIWIPGIEWPVAIWSGVAVMHLLSKANDGGAGA